MNLHQWSNHLCLKHCKLYPPLPREEFAMSMVMKELNLMKNEIRDLKSNLSVLNCTQSSDAALRQEVTNIRQMITHIIHEKTPPTEPTYAGSTTTLLSVSSCTASQISRSSIHVAAWICHGIAHAIPYLQILAEQLTSYEEYWLWPFEFSKLDTIVPGYKGTGISDIRLHEQSALTRGCEGVEILWKKSLPISNVLSIDSDRIFAIQLSVSSSVSEYRGHLFTNYR